MNGHVLSSVTGSKGIDSEAGTTMFPFQKHACSWAIQVKEGQKVMTLSIGNGANNWLWVVEL